jgi:hypothetical protein
LTLMTSLELLSEEVKARASGPGALDHLSSAVSAADDLRDLADELLDRFVIAARDEGRSWSEIGAVLGVTKQAAQQRYIPPKALADPVQSLLPVAAAHARRFRHRYVATEHLLLALCDDRGIAGAALARLAITSELVDSRVNELVGRGHADAEGVLGVSPPTKRVLDAAGQESRRLGHRCEAAAPEHVLLALAAYRSGVAAEILRDAGVREAQVRQQVSELLAREAPELAAAVLHPARRGLRRRHSPG